MGDDDNDEYKIPTNRGIRTSVRAGMNIVPLWWIDKDRMSGA
jgi:hypothetical protein